MGYAVGTWEETTKLTSDSSLLCLRRFVTSKSNSRIQSQPAENPTQENRASRLLALHEPDWALLKAPQTGSLLEKKEQPSVGEKGP